MCQLRLPNEHAQSIRGAFLFILRLKYIIDQQRDSNRQNRVPGNVRSDSRTSSFSFLRIKKYAHGPVMSEEK